MMPCREATRLMSQELDRPLTTGERLSLKFHTLMCDACTRYRGHLHFLRRTAQRYREGRIDADKHED